MRAFLRGNDIAPAAARVVLRRLDQAEIGSAAIRADIEPSPEVVQLELVFLLARHEHPNRRVRRTARHGERFGSLGLDAVEEQEFARTARRDGDIEGLVRFVEDDFVLFGRLAQPVALHAVPAQGLLVLDDIEDRVPGLRPDQVGRGPRDLVRQEAPGFRIEEADRVDAAADGVHRVGVEPVLRARLDRPQVEVAVGRGSVGLARQPVPVEEDAPARAFLRGLSAERCVFLPLAVSPPVEERAVAHRRRRGVRDDPRLQFREDLLLPAREPAERALGPLVLGPQVVEDFRVVPLAQVGPGVCPADVVVFPGDRPLRQGRRRRGGRRRPRAGRSGAAFAQRLPQFAGSRSRRCSVTDSTFARV